MEAFKKGKQEGIGTHGLLKRKGEPWEERVHQGNRIWGTARTSGKEPGRGQLECSTMKMP